VTFVVVLAFPFYFFNRVGYIQLHIPLLIFLYRSVQGYILFFFLLRVFSPRKIECFLLPLTCKDYLWFTLLLRLQFSQKFVLLYFCSDSSWLLAAVSFAVIAWKTKCRAVSMGSKESFSIPNMRCNAAWFRAFFAAGPVPLCAFLETCASGSYRVHLLSDVVLHEFRTHEVSALGSDFSE
jgi:hypothetical protein